MRGAYERGLGGFGVLVVLAIAAGIAYYVYQSVWSSPETPSCELKYERCIKSCRKGSIDNEAAQACQNACKKDEADCLRFQRGAR